MKEEILEFISQKLLNGYTTIEISDQDDLLGSGLIDSLGMMKLVAFIEDKFGVQVPPQDMILENFMNVEAIINYLHEQKK